MYACMGGLKHWQQVFSCAIRLVLMIRISGGAGFWFDVGFNRDGDDMVAEYVPCDVTGRCLALHKKREGYYCFHLPGNGKTVRFHR